MRHDARRRLWLVLASLLAVALVAAACQPAAEPDGDDPGGDAAAGEDGDDGEGTEVGDGDADITLRYAFFAPAATFPAVQMEEWAERLSEETDGAVAVELFPGGTLLGAGEIYDGVRQGVVDVGMDSPAYDVGQFPVSSAIALPVDFPGSQAASLAFLDLLEEYEPAEFEGFEIITAFTTEPAHLQTTEPVTSRDDLQGLELRSAGAGVPGLQRLGASPIGMPMPEVAEALQTGAIDGYLSSREVLQDFGLAEQVGYVTDYAFQISNSFVAVMDADRFAELPDDVQQAIRDLRREMAVFASEYHDEQNVGQALDWAAEEHGVEVVELDEGETEAWDAELQSVIDEWLTNVSDAGLPAEEIYQRVQELRDEHSEDG